MNRLLLSILILIFVLSTVLVCIFHPKTHKPIAFENKNFKISLITDSVKVENNNVEIEINVPEISINTPQIDISVNKSKTQQVSKTQNNTKKQVSKSKPQIAKKQEKNNQKNEIKNTQIEQKQTVEKPQIATETKTNQQPQVQPTVKKVLTEQEEIIAWNKWRSDLQNKLMRDSKISAPIGTGFLFSFTVDKYGNISNLKTWSTNPSYTALAVRVIKPILLSYQKTSVLNFPEGSKRVITNVNGGFTMASSNRYSSPSDYNDYERVMR